jgi:glycosyltransferase involved in cell wall biosynthesis
VRICIVGKYPPTEGGVSAQTYWTCHLLGRAGHEVYLVTNADETELEHRQWFLPGDTERLQADYPGGGRVRVTYTQPDQDQDLYYIPQGRPTMTRLVSAALEVVRRHACDLLLAWYLEPYLLAVSLVAAWTRRPYLVCHAASDIYDLAAQPDLGPAYREAIRGSAGVLTSNLPVDGLGLPADRVFPSPGLFLPAEFAPTGPVLDIVETARWLQTRGCAAVLRTEPMPPGTSLIGAYGKLGEAKGTVELIRAVARVRAAGHPIGLVFVGGGRGWPGVVREVRAAGLADITLTLPMLAPWRIPEFIRACDAVAFLERNFTVPHHRPVPPLEVLACARPLLLSRDVAPVVLPRDHVVDGVVITDPRDGQALAHAVVSVVSRRASGRPSSGVRTEAQVARGYAAILDRVAGEPGTKRRSPTAREVERVVAQHCPALMEALGPGIVQRHWPAAAMASTALLAAYAVADAALLELAASTTARDGLAAQLALAEHHALWVRLDVEGLAGLGAYLVPVRRVPTLPSDPEQLDALVPVTSTLVRIVRFDVDAYAYLRALPSGRRIVKSADQVLLFHKAPNIVHTIARIGPSTRALLENTDGRRSVRALADAAGVAGRRRQRYLALVWHLHRVGVLSFRRDLVHG